MSEPWKSLLPIIAASMLAPIQLTLTIVWLRSSLKHATGWVAGLTAARVAEGALLALAFAVGATGSVDENGPSALVGWLLLALGLLFYAAAVQQMVRPLAFDTPLPGWMTRFESASPALAFGSGVLYLLLSVKSSLLNLLGIATVMDAVPPGAWRVAAACGFIAAVMAGHISILVVAASSPDRAKTRLDALERWIRRHGRVVIIVMGLVFGTFFVSTALQGM